MQKQYQYLEYIQYLHVAVAQLHDTADYLYERTNACHILLTILRFARINFIAGKTEQGFIIHLPHSPTLSVPPMLLPLYIYPSYLHLHFPMISGVFLAPSRLRLPFLYGPIESLLLLLATPPAILLFRYTSAMPPRILSTTIIRTRFRLSTTNLSTTHQHPPTTE